MTDEAWNLSRYAAQQQRSVSRDPIDYPTFVIRPGQEPIDVRLIEASPRGVQARCGLTRFTRGEAIQLHLPLVGAVEVQVMWGLRGCFGGQFAMPLDARSYLDMLAVIAAKHTPD